MILPHIEAGNTFNSINFMVRNSADLRLHRFWTAYNYLHSTWLCPSDGENGGGFRPASGNGNTSTRPVGGPPPPTTCSRSA